MSKLNSSCFTKWDIRFKGQMLKHIYATWLEQAGIQIYPMWKFGRRQDPYCWNAFRPDNNGNRLCDELRLNLINATNEFSQECVTVSMGLPSNNENLDNRDAFTFLPNITDTSYLIMDGLEVVCLSRRAKLLVFNQMSERHFMPTILNTVSSIILTSTIQTISRAGRMAPLMCFLTIMPTNQ